MTSSATPSPAHASDSWTVRHLPAQLAGRTIVSRGEQRWIIAATQPIYHRSTGDVTLVLTLRRDDDREITITTGFVLEMFDGNHFGDPEWIIAELQPHPLEHGDYYAISA